jgi:hypothetical protein
MAQKGFTFKWSADQDYYAGCVVIDDTDGLRYECIADVTANNTAPSADATHWQISSAGTDLDAWFRQASTVYNNGAIALLLTLPTGWYLECTGTGGTTDAGDLVITSPAIGATVTDGTVTWTIREMASTADIPAPVDISGKANVDLDNLSAAGEAKIVNTYEVESYYNSTTGDWYKIYQDGWIEQGGWTGTIATDSTKDITFLKPFADTLFGLLLTGSPTEQPGFQEMCEYRANRTTTGTRVKTYGGGNTTNAMWRAYGKVATSK